MCETTDNITRLAAEGYSKHAARKELKIPKKKFEWLLELIKPTPVFHSYAVYTVRGFEGSISEIIKHFNLDIDPRTVRSRLTSGKHVEDAFFTAHFRKEETVRGFTGTKWEIIRHFNLRTTPDEVCQRTFMGMLTEEAFFYSPSRRSQRNQSSV